MSSQHAPRALVLPALGVLALGILTACAHDPSEASASAPASSAPAVEVSASAGTAATTVAATPASGRPAPTPSESQVPLTQGTQAAPGTTGPGAPQPSLEAASQVWRTAGQAIIEDDQQAFLSVSSQAVLDELLREQKVEVDGSGGLTWQDWQVMGGRGATASQETHPQVGSCVEGAVGPVSMPEGASVTCEIGSATTGYDPVTMGYFFLGQESDGTYTVLGYQRNYQ